MVAVAQSECLLYSFFRRIDSPYHITMDRISVRFKMVPPFMKAMDIRKTTKKGVIMRFEEHKGLDWLSVA